MKDIKYLFIKEQDILRKVVILSIVFVCLSFTSLLIESHNNAIRYHQEYLRKTADAVKCNSPCFELYDISSPDFRPRYILLLLLFLGLNYFVLKKSISLATLLATFLFLIYVHWFIRTRILIGLREVEASAKGLDRIFDGANFFDFSIFVFVLILLFWQISILLRMLIRNTQRKPDLP